MKDKRWHKIIAKIYYVSQFRSFSTKIHGPYPPKNLLSQKYMLIVFFYIEGQKMDEKVDFCIRRRRQEEDNTLKEFEIRDAHLNPFIRPIHSLMPRQPVSIYCPSSQ